MSKQNPLRNEIVGVNLEVPVANGKRVVYTNFDNAASTPSLVSVKKAADLFLEWYSSIHRGTGYKSQLASEWYEQSRQVVLDFVNADPDYHCAILTGNTTDAINRLARKFPVDNDKSIIISHAEHHANDLPWRSRGRVVRMPASMKGEMNPENLRRILTQEGHRARLVSLSGALNVNGTLQPIHELAKVAHSFGVPIAIDAAQLAPHAPINMSGSGQDDHIDFLFISGHKMYAPYGGGALIGPRSFFNESSPSIRGGGAVLLVEPNGVDWLESPEREEAGSPNVLGAITLAAAMQSLKKIGFDRMEEIELSLARRFMDGLKQIEGSEIYGFDAPGDMHRRVGVVAFNLKDIDHGLVAEILSHEGGIGVRNGCFCSHPFVIHMLGLDEMEAEKFRMRMRKNNKQDMPGAVRVSFGLYNTEAEVDRLLALLNDIATRKSNGGYISKGLTGCYLAAEDVVDYHQELTALLKGL
ncbi:aminotransferase class V-fold PLP-dependent enzyme [bacterium]|nr:aminotransferase class V-fold PLP-dependent enzyme [bacterium]